MDKTSNYIILSSAIIITGYILWTLSSVQKADDTDDNDE